MRCASLLIAALLATGAASTAGAQDAEPAPLSDTDLGGLRGGFLTAGGVTFDFGVVVRTYVDDRLALQTTLQWTPAGAVSEQVAGGVPGAVDLADAMDGLLADGIDLTGLAEARGVALVDGDGATALIHSIGGGRVQNLILNAADGRDLRQEIQINLTLPDLGRMQQDIALHRLGAQIAGDITANMR